MVRKSSWKLLRVGFTAAILACALLILSDPQPTSKSSDSASARMLTQFGKLPLYFIENQGQLDQRVGYYLHGKDKSVYFTSDGVVFALTEEEKREPKSLPSGVVPVAGVARRMGGETRIRRREPGGPAGRDRAN